MELVNSQESFFFLCLIILYLKYHHLGVRDYIHVVDLATGHIAAMKKFQENCGLKV